MQVTNFALGEVGGTYPKFCARNFLEASLGSGKLGFPGIAENYTPPIMRMTGTVINPLKSAFATTICLP